jgi:hypothetical protein
VTNEAGLPGRYYTALHHAGGPTGPAAHRYCVVDQQ